MTDDISQQDIDFEIQFCENLLRKNPNFLEGLTLLGDLYTKKGMYKEGLAVDEKLVQLKPEDETCWYNLACSYSLLGDIDLAFRSIKMALKCGYVHFEHLEKDSDLSNLKKDARFQKYYSRVKSKLLKF